MSSVASAGQRRRAYQCLKCWHRSDKVFVEARYRVLNHFLKEHVSLDAVPFYCKWCLFRAFRREDMERHVRSYPRHQAVLKEKGVSEAADFLMENRSPYKISERDVVALSAEESQRHWQAAAGKRGDFMAQAMEATYLDVAVGPTIGAEVIISPSPAASPLPRTAVHLPPQPAVPLPLQTAVHLPPQPAVPLPPQTAVLRPPQPAEQLLAPPPLPAASSASMPAAPTEDWRVLSPTFIDVTQLMNPLQQLLSQFVPGPPAAMAAPTVPVPARQPPPPPPAMAALSPAPQPLDQPVVEVIEEEKVLDNMPTREECRALGDKSRFPSSTISSSTGSSTSSESSQRMPAARHQELLSAIGDLKETMMEVRDSFLEACQTNQHVAKLVLDLAGICAKRSSGQLPPNAPTTISEAPRHEGPPPPANQSFVPIALPRVPPTTTASVPLALSYVPTPILPPQALPVPGHQGEGPAQRRRDRSPLRARNDRRESPRRDRSRDVGKENRRHYDSPSHRRDRRVVRSRWH